MENADFTQLGVNSDAAIRNGALAEKPQFFGGATAETVSTTADGGGWNGDLSRSVYSGAPWVTYGRYSNGGSGAGVFAFSNVTGGVSTYIGHRTILSGY